MKKFAFILAGVMSTALLINSSTTSVASKENSLPKKSIVEEKVDYLINNMTIDEKIGQMVQGERNAVTPKDISEYYLGSVLSAAGSVPGDNTYEDWIKMITSYQEATKDTPNKIPIIYGQDAVHGNNMLEDAVIFPHNIGLGAANNTELMSQIGDITAKELLITGINWTFGPSMPVAQDPRWGRYYESYSSDTEITTNLSSSLIKSLQENNIAACAKHYIGDGATMWGTGDSGFPIDQGDVNLDEESIRNLLLPPYEEAVKNDVKTIMVSFSSINGLKMHENKYWISDVLKEELGFKGFVITDWEGARHIKADSFYDQLVIGANSGIDMFMSPYSWKETITNLKAAVENNDISIDRINDAVRRILKVKFETGLFENPVPTNEDDYTLGQESSRDVARQAVRESLVLMKNNNDILPLKKDSKIFISGPAANDISVQCGAWTLDWQGQSNRFINGATTILEGFNKIAEENRGTIITSKEEAKDADYSIVLIGEFPYAEGLGDDEHLTLNTRTAIHENKEALEYAKSLGKPMIVILVSGRPRIVTDEVNNWDAFVSAWLPGSEGSGVAEVLYGDYDFKGKLPFNWPKSADKLPEVKDNTLYPIGHGLQYK